MFGLQREDDTHTIYILTLTLGTSSTSSSTTLTVVFLSSYLLLLLLWCDGECRDLMHNDLHEFFIKIITKGGRETVSSDLMKSTDPHHNILQFLFLFDTIIFDKNWELQRFIFNVKLKLFQQNVTLNQEIFASNIYTFSFLSILSVIFSTSMISLVILIYSFPLTLNVSIYHVSCLYHVPLISNANDPCRYIVCALISYNSLM